MIFVCRNQDMGKEQRERGNGRHGNGKRARGNAKRETGHRGNGKRETGSGKRETGHTMLAGVQGVSGVGFFLESVVVWICVWGPHVLRIRDPGLTGNGKRVKPMNQKRREEMQEALVMIICV